jgi:hypothetical protein
MSVYDNTLIGWMSMDGLRDTERAAEILIWADEDMDKLPEELCQAGGWSLPERLSAGRDMV